MKFYSLAAAAAFLFLLVLAGARPPAARTPDPGLRLPTTTPVAAESLPHDLVFRGALLVDGSGAPPAVGDLAVRAGRISAVGTVEGPAAAEVDAAGLVLAPGFIDVHTHAENILDLPGAENFLHMGVTSIVTGNCGTSELDLGRFFRAVERQGAAVNVASLIGHNTLRREVMGEASRAPTPAELARMQALVTRAMEDGAAGLSTGLIYLPGAHAETEELIALAKAIRPHGGIYASHMRNEGARIREALAEVFRIAREAGVPAQVSHLKLGGPANWGQAAEILQVLDRARHSGLRITHDQYLYTASSTGLSSLIPRSHRGAAALRAASRDPRRRAALAAEMKKSLQDAGRADYSYAVVASSRAHPEWNGRTIPQVARLLTGRDGLDDQIHAILEIELRGGGAGIFHGMSEDDVQVFLRHPLTMFASDSGVRRFGEGTPHPRGYGNSARAVGRYSRELKLLSLEEAVRRMTSLPADTFRLTDRGRLTPGHWADLVLLDPHRYRDAATYADPHQYAHGVREVYVNGIPVLQQGKPTHHRPGKALRLEGRG
jgi:N-acyl-D-amino-acid deacylase